MKSLLSAIWTGYIRLRSLDMVMQPTIETAARRLARDYEHQLRDHPDYPRSIEAIAKILVGDGTVAVPTRKLDLFGSPLIERKRVDYLDPNVISRAKQLTNAHWLVTTCTGPSATGVPELSQRQR